MCFPNMFRVLCDFAHAIVLEKKLAYSNCPVHAWTSQSISISKCQHEVQRRQKEEKKRANYEVTEENFRGCIIFAVSGSGKKQQKLLYW